VGLAVLGIKEGLDVGRDVGAKEKSPKIGSETRLHWSFEEGVTIR
jgi:hypothetical protein